MPFLKNISILEIYNTPKSADVESAVARLGQLLEFINNDKKNTTNITLEVNEDNYTYPMQAVFAEDSYELVAVPRTSNILQDSIEEPSTQTQKAARYVAALKGPYSIDDRLLVGTLLQEIGDIKTMINYMSPLIGKRDHILLKGIVVKEVGQIEHMIMHAASVVGMVEILRKSNDVFNGVGRQMSSFAVLGQLGIYGGMTPSQIVLLFLDQCL